MNHNTFENSPSPGMEMDQLLSNKLSDRLFRVQTRIRLLRSAYKFSAEKSISRIIRVANVRHEGTVPVKWTSPTQRAKEATLQPSNNWDGTAHG